MNTNKRIKTEDENEAQEAQSQSPAEANRDKIKAQWDTAPDFPALQADLLTLVNSGRWAGVCESWHCAMWQIGTNGAARAVGIAKAHGWKPRQDALEALHRGHLTMGRAGEDHIRAARIAKAQGRHTERHPQAVNLWDAWNERRALLG